MEFHSEDNRECGSLLQRTVLPADVFPARGVLLYPVEFQQSRESIISDWNRMEAKWSPCNIVPLSV